MSKTLVLSEDVYQRLARGAARRGLTVKSLLKVVSEAVELRIPSTAEDRRRGERIERLFAKYRSGPLSPGELAELDRLIDRTYEVAIDRAERLIAEKTARSKRQNGSRSGQQSRPSRTAGR